MVAEAAGLSRLFRLSVLESELSHNSLNIPGDVPSLSRHSGKNTALRAKKHLPDDADNADGADNADLFESRIIELERSTLVALHLKNYFSTSKSTKDSRFFS